MKFYRLLSLFLIASAATVLASCQKPYHEQEERYVFIASNINLPYWQEARAGFLDAAKELGVRAELIGPQGYQPNAELVTFRQTVEEQPTGICLSAARPEIFKEQIDKAIAAGVPVICVDADSPDSKRLTYVGTDNNRAGRESVKQMANLLSGGGRIVVLSIPGQINVDDRVAGVAEALSNYPAIKLIDIIDDKGDVTLKPVAVKSYDTNSVVISGGVEEGAKIVALGVQKLDPSQKVRVVSSLSF